jgi:hypothetical protein
MQTVTTIGLDIAKSVFQVHGVNADGNMVLRRQLKRRPSPIQPMVRAPRTSRLWLHHLRGRPAFFRPFALAEGVEPAMRKSSCFFPDFMAAVNHRGFNPRPAQVSVAFSGLRYLGATADPFSPPRPDLACQSFLRTRLTLCATLTLNGRPSGAIITGRRGRCASLHFGQPFQPLVPCSRVKNNALRMRIDRGGTRRHWNSL